MQSLSLKQARRVALAAQGLLSATTTAGQAAEAQALLNDYGLLAEQVKVTIPAARTAVGFGKVQPEVVAI